MDVACTVQQQADPPYFGIAMIVKNEASTIAETLESVRGCEPCPCPQAVSLCTYGWCHRAPTLPDNQGRPMTAKPARFFVKALQGRTR